ncbi:MAG TPA: HAD hydrolase-like protein, partial [Oligoflexia bacterium]|nr:HAD hydrolase-like protein [Oligoflexia bacterium]
SSKELGRELSRSEEQLVVVEYVKNYRASFMQQNPFHVLPGVVELLDRLVDRENCVVGIQTGNIEDIGELKLRGAGIYHYFSFGAYCASFYDKTDVVRDAKRRLEEQGIRAEEIVVIGDSVRDINAGQSNQCRTIGVATGSFSEDALRDAGADCVLPDLRNAAVFLEQVLSLSGVRA